MDCVVNAVRSGEWVGLMGGLCGMTGLTLSEVQSLLLRGWCILPLYGADLKWRWEVSMSFSFLTVSTFSQRSSYRNIWKCRIGSSRSTIHTSEHGSVGIMYGQEQ
jgi:hypothetical protein